MNKQITVSLILGLTIITGCTTPVIDPFGSTDTAPVSEWRYSGDLHAVMAEATRFRLSIGFPDCTFRTPILETTNLATISDLKEHIVFKKTNPIAVCCCLGQYTFEWFRGEHLLAQVSLHGSDRMRWNGHWDGDVSLTSDSELWLCRFMLLEISGFPEKLKEANQSAHGTR